MTYTETLHWILDKPVERGYSDENARLRIDFVHSLRLKCDSVGWCRMSLSTPDADGLLDRIEAHCREHHWNLRAWYEREYSDIPTDWYVLRTGHLPFAAVASLADEYPTQDGEAGKHLTIKACSITAPGAQRYGNDSLIVPERFRDACLHLSLPGIDFCWIRDKGRYDAPQYFAPYAAQTLPRFVFNTAVAWYAGESELQPLLEAMGGHLPRLTHMCQELRISLPDCVFRSDLPAGGMVQAYAKMAPHYASCNMLLIHKDTAAQLLAEKALTASALIPLLTVDTLPVTHPVVSASPLPLPTREYIAAMDAACTALKAKARPIRQFTEKQAIALLRKAKAARKEDFGKRLAKPDALLSTAYAPLVPYWRIAESGCLSDEYELLSPDASLSATQTYDAQRAAEELASLPEGVVFTRCADGDVVLLTAEGHVLRISHEQPLPEQEWPSLAAFFTDAVEQEE